MASLLRVLNPIWQIKLAYITNTYKALLRDKSIDKVHQIDQTAIEEGRIKPTHLTAAMTKKSLNTKARVDKHLTPDFCIR